MNQSAGASSHSFIVSVLASIVSLTAVCNSVNADADRSKVQKSNQTADKPLKSGDTTSGGNPAADSSKTKPKVRPWKSFGTEERTYNIFKYNLNKPSADAANPDNWRAFDPALFANRKKLIPDADAQAGLGPTRYANPDLAVAMDPSRMGVRDDHGTTIVFAHQGTPLASGWIAPAAGYAYQMQGVLVYGTTNYTPVNYNGNMEKYLGMNRVPVDILSPSGTKEKIDLARLVFAVNDNLLSRPQSKVYPSLIYLKPGEVAEIQGHGKVSCPRPDQPTLINIQTPNGDQSIKVFCAPDNAVIPGKVSP